LCSWLTNLLKILYESCRNILVHLQQTSLVHLQQTSMASKSKSKKTLGKRIMTPKSKSEKTLKKTQVLLFSDFETRKVLYKLYISANC